MNLSKIGIVCANGIGDALLMQISAAILHKLGHQTVTFSKHLPALASWFPGFAFEKSIDSPLFHACDAILLQNDNTASAQAIRAMQKPVYIFYGDHQIHKHGPLRPQMDFAFDPTLCMAQNIAQATCSLFPEGQFSLHNGLTPPPHLIFRKYPKRIAIHPTSTSCDKNWSRSKFLHLRDRLQDQGWEPVFIAPPEEREAWGSPLFPTLSDLASYLYESAFLIGNDSGPGHLASNLGLKTIVIGPSLPHLTYWRPGWEMGGIAHPPNWAHKFKLTRTNWNKFVSINKVFKIFNELNSII